MPSATNREKRSGARRQARKPAKRAPVVADQAHALELRAHRARPSRSGRELLLLVAVARGLGPAEAAQVGADHPVALGERRDAACATRTSAGASRAAARAAHPPRPPRRAPSAARVDEAVLDALHAGEIRRSRHGCSHVGAAAGRRPSDLPRWYRHPSERSGPRLLHAARRRRRSRDRAGARRRGAAPGDDARDDRLRELRAAGDPRLPGLGAHQQVRRGLSRQALLRRLRVRGRGRERWRSSAPRSCSAPST